MISRRVFWTGLGSLVVMPQALACGGPVPIHASEAERERLKALLAAARSQIGTTTTYDPGYVQIAYPGGDVPRDRGVCTDVVIRAYRDGLNIDLQKLVHEDMRKNFAVYPANWGLKRPDRNIDHRRVPNLMTFFRRKGVDLPVTEDAFSYLAGDLVTMMLPGNLPHIAIVSDKTAEGGERPLLIHNIGRGTQEEDVFSAFRHTGHFRFALG